jgi:cobalt-zinc-cadmium efflux system outer membrane protein
VLCLLIALALAPQQVASAESTPASAPVAKLVRDAAALSGWLISHDAQLSAARARVDEASADVGAAGVIPNPELDLGAANVRVGPLNPFFVPGVTPGENGPIYSIGLQQEIELGKRGPRIAGAEKRRDATQDDYLDALNGRSADARYAMIHAVYLQLRQQILDDALASAQGISQTEQSRLSHGAISGIDYDRIVLDEISVQADADRNRAELQAALADCEAALRATCDLDGAGEPDLDSAAQLPPDLDGVGLAERPDIQSAALQGEAARADAKLARRKAVPDPTVGLSYTRDLFSSSGDLPDTLALTLSIPLPFFDHGQHDAARADAHAMEMDFTRTDLLQTAQASLGGLQQRKASLEKSLELLTKTAIPKSEGIVKSMQDLYDRSQVSLTDLLSVRRTHSSLELSLIDLRFDYFTVRNELRRTLGLDART